MVTSVARRKASESSMLESSVSARPRESAAALKVPVKSHEGCFAAGLDPVLDLLEETRLSQAPPAEHPERVALALEDLADHGGATEEILASHPAPDDEGVARDGMEWWTREP